MKNTCRSWSSGVGQTSFAPDGMTNEGENEANDDDEALEFNDGSRLCVGPIFDGMEEVVKSLKMIAMTGKFQYQTNKSGSSSSCG